MGATHAAHHSQPHPFSLTDYEPIPENPQKNLPRRSTYGSFTSLKNRHTEQEIDRYTLTFSTKTQQQNYHECYLQRYRQEYIVSTVEYVDLSKKQFCSQLYVAQVYLEHIPIRLGDVTDIPYADNLYIFRNCLLGFGLLYGMIGYFEVQEDHICINNYGEVKVWLNSDLSKNYPEDYNQQIRSECDMVHKILTLIQKNTSIEQCPIELSEYFIKKHKKYPNFSQALHLLDQYIKEYKCIVPKYCESIFEIFHEHQCGSQDVLSEGGLDDGQESYLETNRGTIRLEDPQDSVPLLDFQGLNARESDGLRDTIKKQANPFANSVFQYLQNEEDVKTRIISQKTERMGFNSRRSSNNNIFHSYNRLQTKRTPVKQNSVYRMTKQIFKPAVHFTYFTPQAQAQARAAPMSPSILYHRNNVVYMSRAPTVIPVVRQYVKNSPLLINMVPKQVKMPQKQRKMPEPHRPASPKKQTSVKSPPKAKKQIFYYDVKTGCQEIDPEIAADLLKYL